MFIEFFLPAYNEEEMLKDNLYKLLNFLRKQNIEGDWIITILVNGSSDDTFKIGKKIASQEKRVQVVNMKKGGKGRALKNGLSGSKADILVYMDVDLAVSLEDIPRLLENILQNDYDLVIGSRLMPDSKIKRSFIREFSSQGYNLLSRLILGHKFSDLQCGFKAIKKDVFKKVHPYLKTDKWFFDTELIAFADFFGYKIKELPVEWEENRYEKRKSKINLCRDSLVFTKNLLKLRKRISKMK
jgi:glycosyltransferase involved in cell wall biosynthesis